MIKRILLVSIMMVSTLLVAEEPAGFLWYNIPKDKIPEKVKKPIKGKSFKQLSYTDQDAVLRFYTMEALHRARNTKKMQDMRAFLSLQDYWLNESTRFKNLFQKTMLAYPEFDYQVTHPASNIGAKITDEVRQAKQTKKIAELATTEGLLFFYRGKSPYDTKQIPIIKDFCERFHFALIPVSVDGAISDTLMTSRIDKGEADRLGVHYFPAVLLVNPKNQKVRPIAYGFTTQDVLMERMGGLA